MHKYFWHQKIQHWFCPAGPPFKVYCEDDEDGYAFVEANVDGDGIDLDIQTWEIHFKII